MKPSNRRTYRPSHGSYWLSRRLCPQLEPQFVVCPSRITDRHVSHFAAAQRKTDEPVGSQARLWRGAVPSLEHAYSDGAFPPRNKPKPELKAGVADPARGARLRWERVRPNEVRLDERCARQREPCRGDGASRFGAYEQREKFALVGRNLVGLRRMSRVRGGQSGPRRAHRPCAPLAVGLRPRL